MMSGYVVEKVDLSAPSTVDLALGAENMANVYHNGVVG